MTEIKPLQEILAEGENVPSSEWQLRAVQSDQCLSYVVWNVRTREALIVDPKAEDCETYRSLYSELHGYLWLGVIDSHTHADHISIAAQLSEEFKAPHIMHALAPSQRVHLRVSKDSFLPAQAAPIQFISTPGHTQDSLTVIWGPFVFGGDTVLYGDTGRDDLPGGDPADHFASLQVLKKIARPELIVLPGHDQKGGRASSWAHQLKINSSLTQSREEFVRESSAFDAPAPFLLKKALRENFK